MERVLFKGCNPESSVDRGPLYYACPDLSAKWISLSKCKWGFVISLSLNFMFFKQKFQCIMFGAIQCCWILAAGFDQLSFCLAFGRKLTILDGGVGTDTGLYTLKKVRVQKEEQLESVNREINIMRLFHHPNLIPLVDSSIISVKVSTLVSKLWFFGFLGARLGDKSISMKYLKNSGHT